MAFKPIYALHKDAAGNIINATASDYSYVLTDWLRGLDPQAGDTIEFGEKVDRTERVDVSKVEPLAIVEGGKKPAKATA